MILDTRTRRSPFSLPSAALGVVGLAAALVGCAPEPAPSPAPTAAFASEEEAFAAAEETYRAYNDAGDARRAGNATPDPQDFLIGTALENDLSALNTLRTSGLHLEGTVEVVSFKGLEAAISEQGATIRAIVCLDPSNARVVDSSGQDVTPQNRADVLAQDVRLVQSGDSLRITDESAAERSTC